MITLVIGLDAATWDAIKTLTNSGSLTTLKHLCESEVSGVLKSTIPPHIPPVWTSVATGVIQANMVYMTLWNKTPRKYFWTEVI